jgi:hypothetical protein
MGGFMRAFLPAALALFFLAAASGAAAVQDPVSAPSDLDRLEKAVYLLENPEEAKKLAERLRPLIEAQKKLDAARMKPIVSVDLTGNLVHLYRDLRARAQMVLSSVRSELKDLPRTLERLTTYLSMPENRQKALSLGIKLGVAFLAGLAVWLFFRRLTRRMQKKMIWEQPLSVSGKTVRALTEAVLKACFWVGLLLFAYLFVHFVAIGQKLRFILLGEPRALQHHAHENEKGYGQKRHIGHDPPDPQGKQVEEVPAEPDQSEDQGCSQKGKGHREADHQKDGKGQKHPCGQVFHQLSFFVSISFPRMVRRLLMPSEMP